jgi:hypothetical protein
MSVLEAAVELIYLQTEDGTWHWCADCAHYPSLGEIAQSTRERPAASELCEVCRALEDSGRCEG